MAWLSSLTKVTSCIMAWPSSLTKVTRYIMVWSSSLIKVTLINLINSAQYVLLLRMFLGINFMYPIAFHTHKIVSVSCCFFLVPTLHKLLCILKLYLMWIAVPWYLSIQKYTQFIYKIYFNNSLERYTASAWRGIMLSWTLICCPCLISFSLTVFGKAKIGDNPPCLYLNCTSYILKVDAV